MEKQNAKYKSIYDAAEKLQNGDWLKVTLPCERERRSVCCALNNGGLETKSGGEKIILVRPKQKFLIEVVPGLGSQDLQAAPTDEMLPNFNGCWRN